MKIYKPRVITRKELIRQVIKVANLPKGGITTDYLDKKQLLQLVVFLKQNKEEQEVEHAGKEGT